MNSLHGWSGGGFQFKGWVVRMAGCLKEKLDRAKAVVFADYKGMNMKQLSELRNKLRDVNGELSVTKNTLMRKALLEGPAHNASSTSNASRSDADWHSDAGGSLDLGS